MNNATAHQVPVTCQAPRTERPAARETWNTFSQPAPGRLGNPLGAARETFILYIPLGTGLREATMAACGAAGFSPRVGQEAPRITSTLSAESRTEAGQLPEPATHAPGV
jgi:hypothetical protein